MNVMSVIPLAIDSAAGNSLSLNVSGPLLERAGSIAGYVVDIGVGVASIFLLIVVFSYAAQILDGGKFEVKMLKPLLIYLVVANFNLVSYPVTGFIRTLQRSVNERCMQAKSDAYAQMAGVPAGEGAPSTALEAWYMAAKKDISQQQQEWEEANARYLSGDDNPDDVKGDAGDESKVSGSLFSKTVSKVGSSIGNALKAFWNWVNMQILDSLIIAKNKMTSASMWLQYGIKGITATLAQWICAIMSVIYSCFGAVMTSFVVAFGPLTFAFAILPGSSNVIKTWFIRLCQFALYSPIVSLVDAFNAVILQSLQSAGSAGLAGLDDVFVVMAVMCCNILCLTSVPTIASMIIEGASGGMSLTGAIGSLTNAVSHIVGIGEGGRDRQQLNSTNETNKYLKGIAEKMGVDTGQDAAAGQNPNK